jgi:N-acetylmuramoyl-L-alanine amidase
MPSVLVELGFLTNKEEEDFLNSEKGQTYMASAIYRAFKNYKNIMEGRNAELVIEEKVEEAEILEEETISEALGASPEKEEKEEKPKKENSSLIYESDLSGLQYKIQITASSKALEKDDEHFLGLEQVDEYLSDGNYKYTAGCSDTYLEAKENLKILNEMGFKGAFIVAFKGDERIPLTEALSLENQ